MRFRLIPLLAALLAAPILLSGCGSETRSVLAPETSETLTPMEATEAGGSGMAQEMRSGWEGGEGKEGNRARTMFVHASPDAPAVDILVGSYKVARGLAFPSNTRYVPVRSGERRVRVNVAGTSTTVIDAQVQLAARRNYSIFAANKVASIEPLVLEDDLTRPAPGKTHVRFIHLSPDAPAVDVAVQGGPVVFANKSFKQYTPFTPLPAGTYDLEVRVAGTSTVALSLPGVRFKEGRIYTVFAKGLLSGTGAQALGAGIIVNGGKSRSDGDNNDHDRDDDDDRDRPLASR
jgi:hypothetical protein